MNNTVGLPDEVLTMIISTIEKYPSITSAKIFGSRAKGNYKRYSDVDLSVLGAIDLETLLSLKDDFEELAMIYRIDVVHYDKVTNKELREHIDRVGKELLD